MMAVANISAHLLAVLMEKEMVNAMTFLKNNLYKIDLKRFTIK
jgi:hypothetical protein